MFNKVHVQSESLIKNEVDSDSVEILYSGHNIKIEHNSDDTKSSAAQNESANQIYVQSVIKSETEETAIDNTKFNMRLNCFAEHTNCTTQHIESIYIKAEGNTYGTFKPEQTDLNYTPGITIIKPEYKNCLFKHEDVNVKDEATHTLFPCAINGLPATNNEENFQTNTWPDFREFLPNVACAQKTFSCDECNYRTPKQYRLVNHKTIHTGEKPYSCDKCDYKGRTKDLLKYHEKKHTEDKPFVCMNCNYRTNRKKTLVLHMRTHTGEKPYNCDKCDYKSSRKAVLRDHMRMHTGEMPYTCDKCEFRARNKSTLRVHKRVHTKEKPFRCKISYRWNPMDDPMGERPFACDTCSYKAGRKKDLVHHLRTHTGEKPYACKDCGFRCITKWYLKKHMETKSHRTKIQKAN